MSAAATPAGQAVNDGASAGKPPRKPNIIFVFADQMRAHVLGCYGNEQVPTPHFDALAAGGATFENALSTWPLCSPYRAMLLTGRNPMANGTVSNDTGVRNDLPSIATACRAGGYATGYIGKWHLEWNRDPFVPMERRLGFDYWAVTNCTHQYLKNYYTTDTPREVSFDGYDAFGQTDLAIRYIQKHRNGPFCLFLSWGPPHDPYRLVPKEYLKKFPEDKIALRENVKERAVVDGLLQADSRRGIDSRIRKERKARRRIIDSDANVRHDYLQGYFAHTAALDDCMGRLLAALKEARLEEDTILVFSSDHGDMLGSHRMGSKQMPQEESIRVPCMMRYPRRIPMGVRTDALLTPVDVMPTLLGLAGVPCPQIDGIDMTEAACGGRSDQRDAALIMKMLPGGNPYNCNGITPWRGVRTKRHTYARLVDGGPWILHDNKADPYQMTNLINSPEHRDLAGMLDRRTDALMKEAGDPGDTDQIAAFRESRRPKG
jgi:arylsulfatase A-like enzyme